MSSRVRTYDARKTITGYYVQNGVTSYLSAARGTLTKTTDEVGDFDEDNPFEVDRQSRYFAVMDGKTKFYNKVATHRPVTNPALAAIPSTTVGLTLPNLTAMAPIWLGQMTPRAQAFDLPVFLGELPDLPSMITQIPDLIRAWGRRRGIPSTAGAAAGVLRDGVGDVGSAFLGWKFGWSPFLRDLMQMLGMMDAVKANIEMLMRLRAGRSIKRSIRLAPQIVTVDKGTITIESAVTTIRARVTQVNSMTHWVTSRWTPLIPMMYRNRSDDSIWREAVRTAAGLTPGNSIAAWWELLPWSWLADWFGKVGQNLAPLLNNSLLLKCDSFCYMRTSQVHVYYAVVPFDEPQLKVSGQNLLHRVMKQRFPLTRTGPSSDDPSPPALPVLSDSQMGILGALLAQKAKGVRT